jgi:hypothetical protein
MEAYSFTSQLLPSVLRHSRGLQNKIVCRCGQSSFKNSAEVLVTLKFILREPVTYGETSSELQ